MKSILGVDIAKSSFDVRLLSESKNLSAQFKNNQEGFEALADWLNAHGLGELHACMEATNRYWEDLADYLAVKHDVSVVNPMVIKGFAMSQLRRNKTDKLDALVIAEYCLKMQPKLWIAPSQTERDLKEKVRYRQTLENTIRQHQSRLRDARSQSVRASIQRTIKQLEEELKQLNKDIREAVKADSNTKQQVDLLTSIPGLAERTALRIITEIGNLRNYDSASAVSADAGLSPSLYQSGTSIKRNPKLSKLGKAALRASLYFPAITAIKFNPVIKAFANRLKAKHKPSKVIIVAVMRKLLHIAYGVIKNNKPFDPDFATTQRSI